MQTELQEAHSREQKQKGIYQRILRLIKEQVESDNLDSQDFFNNLINVENMIIEADNDFKMSPIKSKVYLHKESTVSNASTVLQSPVQSKEEETQTQDLE
jgi:hypothetical protein